MLCSKGTERERSGDDDGPEVLSLSKDRYALNIVIIENKFCTTPSVCTL